MPMSDDKEKDDESQTSKDGSLGSTFGPDFRPLGRRIKVKDGDRGPKPRIRKSVRRSDESERE